MDGWTKAWIVFLVIFFSFLGVRSCSDQNRAKTYGGEMEVFLEPNQKLITTNWNDTSLWFLTKEMGEDDVAESYLFYQKSNLGIIEGKITINEVRMTDEELEEYKRRSQYEADYYNSSNFNVYGDPIFIEYDETTGSYTLLKPYVYDPAGALVAE